MTTATLRAPADAGLRALPDLLHAAEGWDGLRAALSANRSGTIDGAWGSSAALAAAALATDVPGTLLVVVPNMTDISPWVEDIASFTGIRPAVFEAWETWPLTSNKGKLDPTTTSRLRLLQQLQLDAPKVVVCCAAAVCQPVPERADLAARGRTIAAGEIVEPSELAEWLVANGYKRVDAVEYPGEFSRRGGICDIFPPDAPDPVRLEFFGDEVESIRTFAAVSQRSLEKKTSVRLIAVEEDKQGANAPRSPRGALTDYLPPESWVVLAEPREIREQAKHFHERVAETDGLFTPDEAFANLMRLPSVVVSALPRPSVEASVHLRVESVERFSGSVHRVRDELDSIATGNSSRVLIACQSEAEVHRLTEVLRAGKLAESHRLQLVTGHVRAGFRLVESGTIVLGSHEIFHKDLLPPGVKVQTKSSRQIESRAIDSFLDLNDGDYVVHVAHGIARFRGMKMLSKTAAGEREATEAEPEALANAQEENLILEFRDGVFLYVPATRIDLVQKYVGGHQTEPELSQAPRHGMGAEEGEGVGGGPRHGRRDDPASGGAAGGAGVRVPAGFGVAEGVRGRVPVPGDARPALGHRAEVKADLEKPKPMDRLICGDVGYGKTEVAIRAAFKAVDSGKQVAILVPTTVLAEQHYRTFSQRFAEYPFMVEVVNRFKGGAKQKEILKRVECGEVDVIVGTHRLCRRT
jgi:transcription-repair coupling factor (superfamily II helicase)